MRPATILAAGFALTASPAFATGSIFCSSAISPSDGPQLSLVVGHGEASGVLQARFSLGGESFATGESGAPTIAQSWIDRDTLRIDIVDANAEIRLVRLDTRRRGTGYAGILIHGGRTWRVRCSEAG